MTQNCNDLATKQELQGLSGELTPKVNKAFSGSEAAIAAALAAQAVIALLKPKVATATAQAASATVQAAGASSRVATVGAKVNGLVNSTGRANAAALSANLAARKAAKQAAFAQTRAASAARLASSASRVGARALSLVGGVLSILGTFASVAAVAVLAQQIANLVIKVGKQREYFQKLFEDLSGRVDDNAVRINESISIGRENREDLDSVIKTNAVIVAKIAKIDGEQVLINSKIKTAERNYITTQNKVDQANKKALELNRRIEETNARVDKVNSSNTNDLSNNQTVQDLRNELVAANEQIESLTGTSSQLKQQLEALQDFQTSQRIDQLTNNDQQQQVRIRDLNDKVTNFDLEIQRLGKKGIELESSIGTNNQNLNTQVNQLRNEIPTTVENLVKNPETIKDISTQVNNNNNNVNQQQVNELNSKLDQLNRNVPQLITPTNISIAVGAGSIIQQILQRTNVISPCQAPALVPPVGAQARANNAAVLGFQALNTGQNVAIQNTVNAVSSATTAIGNTLNNASYGLQKIQNFASTAWQATRADKLVQVLNTALIINNGFYLSKNILSTVGDALSMGLEAVGIKDSEGNALDINSFVSSTITSWISSVIGTSNYEAIVTKMKTQNRIYQSAANLYDGIRSMTASAEEIAEETGIDVARIGNALRDSGTVDFDSYDHMAENPRWKGRIFEALEKADDLASSMESITSEAVDLSEQVSQFREDKKEFEELINKEKKEVNREEEVAERRIDSLPEATEEDKLESEE